MGDLHRFPLRHAPGADGGARPRSTVTPFAIDGQQLPLRTLDDIAREHGVEAMVIEAAIRRNSRELRPPRHITIMDDLRNDWRSTIEGIRNEPYTHGLIAILGFLAGLLLVALPVLVGVGK